MLKLGGRSTLISPGPAPAQPPKAGEEDEAFWKLTRWFLGEAALAIRWSQDGIVCYTYEKGD